MKRFLVIFAVFIGILVAAAACGGGSASSYGSPQSRNTSQGGGTAIGAPAKGVPDQAATGGGTTHPGGTVVPPTQGPQVIRQNQLGQITGQIEQLKGQIQYIEHNVAFSTVTVQLTEAGAPVTTSPSDNWGFVSALSDAAHNFVTTINYLITGLGAVGPVVIVLGLGYLLWRRAGRPGWRHA